MWFRIALSAIVFYPIITPICAQDLNGQIENRRPSSVVARYASVYGTSFPASPSSCPVSGFLAANPTNLRDLSPLLNLCSVDDEKKRVPKPERKKKEDEEAKKDKEEDDSGCFELLATDCLLDMFLSPSEDKAPSDNWDSTIPPPRPHELIETPKLGSVGFIEPRDPASGTLASWNAPGGSAAGATIVAAYLRGSRVRMSEWTDIDGATWIKVDPQDTSKPIGWISIEDYAQTPERDPFEMSSEQEFPGPFELTPEPKPIISFQPSAGQLAFDIGIGDALDASAETGGIDDDYKHAGFRWGLGGMIYPAGLLRLSLDYHYFYENGNPAYNYVDADSVQIDIPLDSSIKIHELRLMGGTAHQIENGPTHFYWGIGPLLTHVEESAQIEYGELEDGDFNYQGKRRDSIAEWKLGLAAELGLAYSFTQDYQLGVNAGISYIPWDGKRQESLTLDYLEDNGFLLVQIGITFRYSIHR